MAFQINPAFLRNLNLFAPYSQSQDVPDSEPSQSVFQHQPDPNQGPDIASIFNQYQPQHTAQDAFTQMLSQYPQREQPSTFKNILGVIASLGAGVRPVGIANGQIVGFQGGSPQEIMQAGDMVRYRPFYQKLEDWTNRAKPMEQAATNERFANQNERLTSYELGTLLNRGRNTDIRATDVEGKNTSRQTRDAIAQEKEEAYERWVAVQEYKSTHPNSPPKADRNGVLYGINPQTNEAEIIKTKDGKPVVVTSETEKQQLIQQRQESGIRLRTKGRIEEKEKTNWDGPFLEKSTGKTIYINKATGDIREESEVEPLEKPGTPARPGVGAAGKPPSGLQKMQAEAERAQQYIARHPEAANWITVDKTTGVRIKDVDVRNVLQGAMGYTSRFTKEQRDAALKFIFPEGEPTTVTPAPATVAPTAEKKHMADGWYTKVGKVWKKDDPQPK